MNLRATLPTAIAWQLAARIVERGLRFGSSVILARVLAPEDFGALAAVLVVAGMAEALTALGIDQAIAQSARASDAKFLGTAFRMSAFRGVALALAIFLSAPLVGWYFERDDLDNLVRVVAIASLCTGLANPWVQSERRALRLQPLSISMIAAGLAQVTVALVGASMGLGAFALAFAYVAAAFAGTLAGWAMLPRRLDLGRDEASVQELRGFIGRAAGIPFLIALFLQMPALVLGRATGLGELGIFTLAQRLTSLPGEIALPVFGSVLTPAYAQLRDDLNKLRRAWLLAMMAVLVLIAPAAATVAVLDGRVAALVYGEAYAGPNGLIALLALGSLFSVATSCCGPLFWGVGRPDLDRIAMAVRLGALLALALPATTAFGAVGFAAAFAGAHFVAMAASIAFAARLTRASFGTVVRALFPALGLAAIVAGLTHLMLRIAIARGQDGPWMTTVILAFGAWAMIALGFGLRRARRAAR